jgi:fatty-acyl-CoA synthase
MPGVVNVCQKAWYDPDDNGVDRGGHNIDPAITEEPLYQLPQVQVAAAVGRPDPRVGEMPLTTVGKIFKPALKWKSIKHVYQGELEALGDLSDGIAVEVGEDKVHGSLASITIKAAQDISADTIRKKADELLGAYTVRYRLEIVS